MCSVLQPLANQPQAINGATQQAAGQQPLAMPQVPEMAYSPQVVPAPVLLSNGNTLYSGETTATITDPLIALLDTNAAGTHDFAGYSGSQCSTAASVQPQQQQQQQQQQPQPQELLGDNGDPLIRYTCPHSKRVWLCEKRPRKLPMLGGRPPALCAPDDRHHADRGRHTCGHRDRAQGGCRCGPC